MAASLALTAPPAAALTKNVFSTAFGESTPVPLTTPTDVAVDQSTGDLYVTNPIANASQRVVIAGAAGGTYTFSFKGQTTRPLAFNEGLTGAQSVQSALEALSTIGAGNAGVRSLGGQSYLVEFVGARGDSPQPQLVSDSSGLSPGGAAVEVTTEKLGSSASDVEKFDSEGHFILIFGKGVDKTTGANLCTAASGDECQSGAPGTAPGSFTDPEYLAVDNSGGPSGGDLYVGDHVTGEGSGDVQKFGPEGNLIASWGKGGLLDGTNATDGRSFVGVGRLEDEGLTGVSVDPAGNLFVFSGGRLFEFSQEGGFRRDIGLEGLNGVGASGISLAVDSADNFYSLPTSVNSSSGAYLGSAVNGVLPSRLTIDLANRDLYLTLPSGLVEHTLGSCLFRHETCAAFDTFGAGHLKSPAGAAIDEATGTVYVADPGEHRIAVFDSVPFLPDLSASAEPHTSITETLDGHLDPAGAGNLTACKFQYVTAEAFDATAYANLSSGGSPPCAEGPSFSAPADVHASLSGLKAGTEYHLRLLAENANGPAASLDQSFETLPSAPLLSVESLNAVRAETALAHAQINPGGGDSTYHTSYHVEYVTQEQFEGHEEEFEKGELQTAAQTPSLDAGSARTPQPVSVSLSSLAPDTTYRYHLIAHNASGTAIGTARTFTTLPFVQEPTDTCPNAHVRQQTAAALLLDCRAYELVSASGAGGYDVESSLIAGQTPFAGYPEAGGRVLYGVHGGGIPGTNHPTDRGVDPYLATRGENGWSTEYVGIPANNPEASGSAPFSSTPSGADAGLRAFAFGAPGGCSPCFSGGYTGIPVRLPGGELVQGMVPAPGFEPGSSATPDGYIANDLAPNGEHFIFGSTSQFAPGANNNTGEVSIYDRNLTTGETHVVSNAPSTEDFPVPLPCLQGAGKCNAAEHDSNGISELAVSADGTRILLGQKVSEDADHNVYWHLYMDVNDSVSSIDLTPGVVSKQGGPGFPEGVLFAGMTADGSKVFFTTPDRLLSEDTDQSPDLYQAEVSESGATLQLLSSGEAPAGNTNSCNPVANANGPHWNALGSTANCGVLAIGGGGGVSSKSGSVYFLSPERLAGSEGGTLNRPNLYLAAPGSPPRFIATLSPADQLVIDAAKEAEVRHSADFQLTPDGRFLAFPSTVSMAGGQTAGHTALYRYDDASETLLCISCAPTETPAEDNAGLAPNGLSLAEDGRVFFDSTAQLAATDTDEKQDVYEWEPQGTGTCAASASTYSHLSEACLALISSGTSAFASGLLGAEAGGKDVYFFTRDSLTPQDRNGPTMKIYDAREGGGFPYLLPQAPCRASDECHGPSSAEPGQVPNGTELGTPGNYPEEPAPKPKPCKPGFVRRHGRCVKRPHHHAHAHHRRGGRR